YGSRPAADIELSGSRNLRAILPDTIRWGHSSGRDHHRCGVQGHGKADFQTEGCYPEQHGGDGFAGHADSSSNECQQYDFDPVPALQLEPGGDAANHRRQYDSVDGQHREQPTGFRACGRWYSIRIDATSADASVDTRWR